jgi:electron transfer flavoprotein alpha subunit
MKVLAFLDQRDAKLKSAAFEVMTAGAKLAGSTADLAVLVVGNGVSGLANELKGWGADKIYVVEGAEFAKYNVSAYTAAVEAAVKAFGAKIVIGASTPMGRDLLPRAAARLDAGMLTDLISVELQNGFVHGKKPMYAGKCLANLSLQNCEVQIVSIRPNVIAANKSGSGSATVETLAVKADTSRISTREIRKGANAKPDLTEATRIVSGGRAMANAENFKILNECADVIGATVGASRAAVDSGYATHDMQVGQTGKTVNPNLYIACGISGSIQHMAGMRTSKVIVAVNTDAEAPIFGVASYGIVGDLFQVVPLLTKKLKEVVGH